MQLSEAHLHAQEDIVVDAALPSGSLTQTIEVKGVAPLLRTLNPLIGTTVGSQVINDLPLDDRKWTTFDEFGAGVTYGQPGV